MKETDGKCVQLSRRPRWNEFCLNSAQMDPVITKGREECVDVLLMIITQAGIDDRYKLYATYFIEWGIQTTIVFKLW